jgi:capsular polysaccharide transport system permease protein
MLEPAELEVTALTNRLNELRARMSGQGETNTSAAQMNTYVQLTNEQAFADNNLLVARQNYQQAYTHALSLQRYLEIIAKPVAESRPSSPTPWVILLIAFVMGCGLAGALNLVRALYRSFRHV